MSKVHDLEALSLDGVELGRYRALEGDRALIAFGARERVGSDPRPEVVLVDVLVGHGNEFLVREGFRDADELNRMVAGYVEVAGRWDVSPMEFEGLETILALLSIEEDSPAAF